MKHLLHLILPVLIFCSAVEVANAQYVTIPDTNFVNWLNNNGYSQCLVGNQLDTTCNAVVNATSIDCSGKNINSIEGIQYFDNLLSLYCNFNNITSLPNFPPLLYNFEIANNQLTSLPLLIGSIHYLDCGNNQINYLPSLPLSLHNLLCYGNHLNSLPSLPLSLNVLDCSGNQLAYLPLLTGLSNLHELTCGGNPLNSLPLLPSALITLKCFDNQLSFLPQLPNSLQYLFCLNNQLTSLPNLPSGLLILDCDSNQLISLPQLPNTLEWLFCEKNNLTALPSLSSSLNVLKCSNNLITSLPSLPSSLTDLICNFNQLTFLPTLPASLGVSGISCASNNLMSLPELPDSLGALEISNNPLLKCLPKIKKINLFRWYNTGISCLPNYGQIIVSNPPILSLPICDIFNTNGCQFFWNISGKMYSDTISNCTYDLSEKTLANLKLKLFQDSILIQETFSNQYGNYSFDTDTGNFTFTVDTTDLPFYVSCPVSGFNSCYVASNDSVVLDKNFGVICKTGFDVGVNAVAIDSGIFRPANFARIHFYAGDMTNKYGLHCASGVSGTVQIVMSGNATYIGPAVNALTPVQNGDTLNYTIADFGNVNFYSDFGVVVQTDTTAQAGDQICFDVSVMPTNGDNVAANNVLTHCFTVVNSYDPNLKSVYPTAIIDDKNGKLTYTINFQNTGTATAQHIYIMDTLDANLDVSSFELLAYSVQPVVQIIGNVARFNFPNINLPDSNSNEPGSHGFVQFRIKLKDGLSLHTSINNTSYIYFDFNSPVQTNSVVDTLLDCDMIVSAFNISQTSFCKDDTLFANVQLADDAVVNWYLDNVLIESDTIISIPNISLGNHTLKTEVITYYCTKEISTQIVFNDLPAINLGNDTAACNSLQLNAGTGFTNYLWSDGSTTQNIVANLSSLYSVTVTDGNGCSNNDVISITINPLPTISFNAFSQDTICLTHGIQTINNGNPPGGNFSGVGVSGNTFDPTIAGVGLHYINYEFTDSLGCMNAATDSVFVDLCAGVITFDNNNEIKIYPNPTTNSITLIVGKNTNHIQHGQLELFIYDLPGNQLRFMQLQTSKTAIDITDLSAGSYVMKIFEEENLKGIQRFVKIMD